MNVIQIMCRAAAAALAIVAVLGGVTPARAAVVHWTFSGVMDAGGVDFHDTFGLAASGGFGGQTITGHLFLDTATAPAATVGPDTNVYENFSGAPWLWGSFTLNGVTRTIGPDFRTYSAVYSSDFGPDFDFVSFDTNADFEQIDPTERLFMRSGLSMQLIDLDGIILPGKELPTSAFDWVPGPSDFGIGQFSILDQLEMLPNGPLTTFAAAEGVFVITDVSAAVVAVDGPASLPVFAAGLFALALLACRRLPRRRFHAALAIRQAWSFRPDSSITAIAVNTVSDNAQSGRSRRVESKTEVLVCFTPATWPIRVSTSSSSSDEAAASSSSRS